MKKIIMIFFIISGSLHGSFVQRFTKIASLVAYYKSVQTKKVVTITGIDSNVRKSSLLYLLKFNNKKNSFFLKEPLNLAETKERALINYLIQQERNYNDLPEVIIFSDKDKKVVEDVVKKVFQYDSSIKVIGLYYDPLNDSEKDNK